MEIAYIAGVTPFVIAFVVFLFSGIRIIDQYERAVVFTLGKFTSMRDPGLNWILPVIQRMTKVDMRVTTTDIPKQEVITKDNVPVAINAVVYFQVEAADKSILNIQDYVLAVSQYGQAALRDVIGGIELDSLLSEREKISDSIKEIVDGATKDWGINVTDIKIQDIELPADMKRVMAKQAESERERRATVIRAEGEYTAAAKLSEAAEKLSKVDGGIALRTLTTIEKASQNPAQTIIFTIPTDFFEGMKNLGKK